MRGSVETTAPPNEKISCVTCCNRFLEKTEKALRVNNWRMEDGDGRCHVTIQGGKIDDYLFLG